MGVDIVAILIILAIGAVAGWLAGQLVAGGGFGLIGNIVLGIVGSFVGTFVGGLLSPKLGLGLPELVNTIIWSTIGAVIVLLVLKLIKKV